MNKTVNVFSGKLILVERISYFLIITPFLTDFLSNFHIPEYLRDSITELSTFFIIFAFIFFVRAIRREIARLEQVRHDLTHTIIHDLKNPLSSIIMSLKLTEEQMDKQENCNLHSELLDLSLRNANLELKIVETLQDMDRLETADLTPDLHPVELMKTLEEAMLDMRQVAIEKGINMVSKPENQDSWPELESDPVLLKRILFNLLFNAMNYTPQNGWIFLHAGFSDGYFRFEIEDTGSAIPEEYMEKAFSKFNEAEAKDKNNRQASGIGLYFCRLAVEALGGTVSVKSARGSGAKFLFTLPAGVKAAAKL